MTGIMMALLGSGGGRIVTTGSSALVILTSYQYFYGYNAQSAPPGGVTWGSINNNVFSGATVRAVYSYSNPGSVGVEVGKAIAYTIIFSGNRSAGFFNTLSVAGTPVSGTLGAPSYNATFDETTFVITLAASAATLFVTTDGVAIPIVLT